jgi:hypothetical protein
MLADPAIPSLVAEIVAPPGAVAVTKPVLFTVATDAALVVQATLRPVSAVPDASRGVAANCDVDPTLIGDVPQVTETDATAAGGGGGGAGGGVVIVSVPAPPQPASRKSAASAVGAAWAFICVGIGCGPEG